MAFEETKSSFVPPIAAPNEVILICNQGYGFGSGQLCACEFVIVWVEFCGVGTGFGAGAHLKDVKCNF